MREIDPHSESRLTEALRGLAASSPKSAPPELAAGLLGEFRRFHTRRRRIRQASISAVVACVALAVSLAVHRLPHEQPKAAQLPGAAVGPTEKQAPIPAPVTVTQPGSAAQTARQILAKANNSSLRTNSVSRTFLALPGYDPAVPTDELHVMRVQLPASALWKVGAPVAADAGSRRMTADFVVSQDGTPFAVRLVQ